MIKYEVYEETREFRGGFAREGLSEADVIELYEALTWREPELKGSFDTLEEAEAELAAIYPSTSNEGSFVEARLGYISEEEYDDGEALWTRSVVSYAVKALEPDSRYILPSVKAEGSDIVVEYDDDFHRFDFSPAALDIYSRNPGETEPYETQDEAEEAFVEDVRNELDEAFRNLPAYFTRDEIDDLVTDITWRALSVINDSWAE